MIELKELIWKVAWSVQGIHKLRSFYSLNQFDADKISSRHEVTSSQLVKGV